MTELKPCPFCGGSPEVRVFVDWGDVEETGIIICPQCYAQTHKFSSAARAIEAWNSGKIHEEMDIYKWLRKEEEE